MSTQTIPANYQMGEGFKQAQLMQFEKNYIRALNQTESKLLHSPAVKHMDIKGISNISSIGDTELTEVTDQGSNPDKVYEEMSAKNRRSVQRRFTKTYLFDDYDKCVNLTQDPTSELFTNLKEAMFRMTDRCIVDSSVAPVYIGGPNEVPTLVSAEDDGVLVLDCKTGFTYEKAISPAITLYENNYIKNENITLAISSLEKQDLRNDEKYINAHYSNNNTVDKGNIINASGFHIVSFAGTQNGIAEVEFPVLPENDGVRTNLFLAPDAIAFAIELGKLKIGEAAKKVNSWEITIDVWVKAVRRQGKRVIKALSTM